MDVMKINTAVPYLWYFVAKLSINQDMLNNKFAVDEGNN